MREGSHGCLIMGSHFAAAHTEAFVPLNTELPIQPPHQPPPSSLKASPVDSKLVTNFAVRPPGHRVFSATWLTTYLIVKK